MAERPLIFDHRLIRQRRKRVAAVRAPDFLICRVADDLAERLAAVLRHFPYAVDLGTPGGALVETLATTGKTGLIITADPLVQACSSRHAGLAVAAHEEALPFRDRSLDLVVSALSLQFANDLPGVLMQIRRALKPDGLFIAALPGGDTLTELRQSFAAAEADLEGGVSPRVMPMLDVRAAGALLQRVGFALPVTDIDRVVVRYDSPLALMRDLRALAATNPMLERSRRPLKRALLERMIQVYGEKFSDADGRIRATFDIVWLSGWAPHPDQQKPLAPGSAQTRLADALGVKEHPAGDKAGSR
jgi:SAM-dependent methyltransferase